MTVEFLSRELSACQARIVELDTIVDDKEKRVKILQARVKFLEDRDNEQIYRRYFEGGSNADNPKKSNCSDHIRAPHTSSCHLHQQYACNYAHYPVPSTCASSFVSEHAFNDFASQVRGELASLRTILESIRNTNEGQSVPNLVNSASDISRNPNINPSSQHNVQENPEIQGLVQDVDPNSSVASIESMLSTSALDNLN